MRTISFVKAINEALTEEMLRDEDVIVFGEDVGKFGGIFGATRGLQEKYGFDRVRDTPIAEGAIAGCAVGAARAGLRPVAELMYGDFLLVCMDEVFHLAAKSTYITGGKPLPLVFRAAEGASHGAGPEHSNCLESLFMHAPGLKIVVPSTPYDAKGLLKAAIRDNNPVLFLEHKQMYQKRGEVPEEEYVLPIGKAAIRREGTSVSIITYGLSVQRALDAAKMLEADGIDAEVIDLRSLAPLDKETMFESVKKTHAAVVVEEGNLTCGVTAELSSLIQEELFDYLDAPVRRVAALDVPIMSSVKQEEFVLPSAEKIVAAVKSQI